MRPRYLLPASLGLLLLAFAVAGCSKATTPAQASAALPKVRFKSDWYPQGEHGGFYQALARGFYKEAGIDVEIVPGGPGVRVPQVLLSGEADLAMGRSDDIISYDAAGLPFVIVGVYMERDPQAIMVHEESDVKTFADLKGRSIMAEPGSNWLQYVKMRYQIDFNLIPLNFGVAQFLADKNFIQQCFVTNEPYFVGKNGGHARTLLLSDSGFNPYRVIYTTQRYLDAHPNEVRAFVAASMRGWDDFMSGDPAPAKALITKANPNMPEEFMNYSIQALKDQKMVYGKAQAGEKLGLMTRKRMQEQDDFLVQLKIIAHPVPLDKFVRFDFLPADLKALAD